MKKLLAMILVVTMLFSIAPLTGWTGLGFVSNTKAVTFYQNGDHIQFGSYPQSRVSDEDLLAKLAAADKKWLDYGYLSSYSYESSDVFPPTGKTEIINNMRFADFTFEGIKYRAVEISDYRTEYQEENGYTSGVYYFVFEPLNWRILDIDTGLVLCESIIDAQPFQNEVFYGNYFKGSSNMALWQNSSRLHYANDYISSYIQGWLSHNFYDTAFTEGQKNKIRQTTQENMTNYGYKKTETNDKIFLLSKYEATNQAYGFPGYYGGAGYHAVQVRGTDYALCQGLEVYRKDNESKLNSCWWLRTPGSGSAGADYIAFDGLLSDKSSYSASTENAKGVRGILGVRPACQLMELMSYHIGIVKDYTISVVLNGDESETVSDITIDQKTYSIDVSLSVAQAEKLKGKEVYVETQEGKVKKISPIQTVEGIFGEYKEGTDVDENGFHYLESVEINKKWYQVKEDELITTNVENLEGLYVSAKLVDDELFSIQAKTDYGIAIFSTEKSLCVQRGEKMWLGFGLIYNEQLDKKWKKMAIVVSDKDVIRLGEYNKTDYGYALEVEGLQTGASSMTITDTATGANIVIVINVYDHYTSTHSYDINNMPEFYPSNDRERKLKTNIYDQNGIYVNNFTCEKKNGKYAVSFDVYNARYHYGAVDVFDKDGNWSFAVPIDKHEVPTDIYETGEATYYLISDLTNHKLLTYEQASYAKRSAIQFEVEDGGYFTITNNIKDSLGVFLYNGFDLLFSLVKFFLEKLTMEEAPVKDFYERLKEFVKKPIDLERFAKNLDDKYPLPATLGQFLEVVFKNNISNELTDIAKNIGKGNIQYIAQGFVGLFQNILNSIDFSLPHLLSLETGIAEEEFKNLTGPIGGALELTNKIGKAANLVGQIQDIVFTINKPYACVYTDIGPDRIQKDGIVIHADGNVDAKAILQVFKISDSDVVEVVLNDDDMFKTAETYNICFVKDEQLVQPQGKVKVYVPIPAGMNGDTCNVYRKEDEGWTILDAYVEGNYLVFETDHFSLYVIIGDREELTVETLPTKTVYHPGDILDTRGLSLKASDSSIVFGFLCTPSSLPALGKQEITVTYGHASTTFTVDVIDPDDPGNDNPPTTDCDHVWNNGEVTITATCAAEGVKTFTCTVCKTTKTEPIAKTADHKWDKGKITKAATCAAEGVKTFTCTICGTTKTETIPKRVPSEPDYLPGDVDGDGELTSGDARLALRASVQLEKYEKGSAQFAAADVDGSGVIESSDARLILRASVKLEDPAKWGK